MSTPYKSVIQEIEKLRKELHRHDYLYYVLAQPEISDEQYDGMMRELESLESRYPALKTADSPTMRVGGETTKEFRTVTHSVQMLSLSNTYSEDDIRDFDRRVRSLLPGEPLKYVCELKFDGVSLSVRYEKGILTLGSTRGDGMRGDDITANVRTIRSIPLRLNTEGEGTLDCEVRGEVIMNREDFERMNGERERAGDKTFINPRNSTAGTLKLQDSKIVATRPLKFYAYGLRSEGKPLKSHNENLQLLRRMGFLVDGHATCFESIEGAIEHWKEWEAKRDSLPFDIDGVVVKVDSLIQQEKLGAIAKSPRWAIACKFASRKAETVLKDIRLQVGRMGTITPVADLEPVFIGGITVSRASLYNEDYIKQADIRIGDCVVVERGGDVIPKVTAVVPGKRREKTKSFRFPSICPECGSKLVRPQDEANYFCENSECPRQIRARIEHWASRGAMDIQGLGEAVVNQLVDNNFIKSAADLYGLHLHREELIGLERWGEKSAENLLGGIEESKQRPYHRVLFALGIRHVGSTIAPVLADHFPSIGALMEASQDDLQSVHEIGPKIAQSVAVFFRDKHNRMMIKRLQKGGLHLASKGRKKQGLLSGRTFVLTGSLSSMTRTRAKELIEENGGRVASGISKSVDALVIGEEAGSKLDKAKKLGIELWDEEKFLKSVNIKKE